MEEARYRVLLDRLDTLRRVRATLDAEEQVILHALVTDPPQVYVQPDPSADRQWVREDVACTLRIAPITAQAKLVEATVLVEDLPHTLDLLARGEISLPHARRLAEACYPLSPETIAAVEARVLPRAPEQTPGQFAASVRRAVHALDTRDQQAKVEDAVAQRRVCFTPQDDGTTELWALLPAEAAAALRDAIDQRADTLNTDGDERTADQRRADALTDLALGGEPLRPRVNVTVSLSTLLGLDEQPGELDRHGPIPAALARALAFDPTGTWRRLLTDEQGQVLDAGRSTYRPPTALARVVTARQTTCVFPGCRRTAARCELDHIQPWADGGHTSAGNLQPLCRRHHHLKHDAGWNVWRLADGTTRWRSPTGHTYDRPPDEIPRDTTTDHPVRPGKPSGVTRLHVTRGSIDHRARISDSGECSTTEHNWARVDAAPGAA